MEDAGRFWEFEKEGGCDSPLGKRGGGGGATQKGKQLLSMQSAVTKTDNAKQRYADAAKVLVCKILEAARAQGRCGCGQSTEEPGNMHT